MYPRYFGLRRVNPYRGVMQVVEAGEGTAHSFDGITWHLRADDGYGLMRPVGVWEAGVGLKLGHAPAAVDLVAALEAPPKLPFPIFDVWELWLLAQDSGLPLALIDTARDGAPRALPAQPQWHPFVLSHTGFVSVALLEAGIVAEGVAHRDWLARQVNAIAHPHPMAQWFKRGQDGVGHGAEGVRLPHEWRNRVLPAEAFPALLAADCDALWGNSRLEQSVIADYHAALAPILLQWPRLSTAQRDALEALACEHPRWLARVRRLLPRVVNTERLNAALVAARLMTAQGLDEPDWIAS